MAELSAFEGFPEAAFRFFTQLAAHNERAWLQEHKDVYERACREPMRRLIAGLGGDPSKAYLTRINRDIRFSRDKAPYRTYIAAGVHGNYLHFSAKGLYVGTGFYKPEAPVLARFRDAIADSKSGPELARIVAALRRKGYKVETHEQLKSVPRGYPADHPRVELLRMKDLFAGTSFERAPWLSTPRALTRIKQAIGAVAPLRNWVRHHVKPEHHETAG